jgi:hypothetical protein
VIAFRDMLPADRHFVVSAWTQSYKRSRSAGFIQAPDWYRVMDAQVELALVRPDVRTIVAYDPEADPAARADLLGFITFDGADEPPLVYYTYVKEHYRRAGNGRIWEGPGMARRLFAAAGIDPESRFFYACDTKTASELRRKIPLARFEPDRGRYPKHERRSR